MNRGSLQDMNEMLTMGTETKARRLSTDAGQWRAYLKTSNPARNRVPLNRRAFSPLAIANGSCPKRKAMPAKATGYMGGYRVSGSPLYVSNPPPDRKLLAALM